MRAHGSGIARQREGADIAPEARGGHNSLRDTSISGAFARSVGAMWPLSQTPFLPIYSQVIDSARSRR
jgi:hypothetical protein